MAGVRRRLGSLLGPAGSAWDKTAVPLTGSTNLSTLPRGIHRVPNSTVATALGLRLKDQSSLVVTPQSASPTNYSAWLDQTGFDGKGGVTGYRAWRDAAGVIGPWEQLSKYQSRVLEASENGSRLGDGGFGVLADRAVASMPQGVSGRVTEGTVGDTTWTQLLQSWTTSGAPDLLTRSMSTTVQQTWQRPESPRAVEHTRRELAALRAELSEVRADGSVPSSAFTASAATIPMRVPTPDGTGQATHPSVVDVPAGWNGHRYWMAYTPYAFANDALEDPVVAWSDNGAAWTSAGADSFPLDDAPGGVDFNSDTNAVLHNGTLYVFWRRSDSNGTKIWVRSSTNGTTWTAKAVAWDPAGMSAFSPSVVKTSTGWRLWFVGGAANARKLRYVDTTAAVPTSGWGSAVDAVTPLPPGREPWHVEVALLGGRWWGLLTDTTVGLNGVDCEVRLMQSADGITWDVAATQLIPKLGHSHDSLYKATMALTGTALKPTISVWYSGVSADKGWWLYRSPSVSMYEPAGTALASRDTKWRDITSLLSQPISAGRLLLRRVGSRVSVRFDGLQFSPAYSGTIAVLPPEFRPALTEMNALQGGATRVQVTLFGNVQIPSGSTTTAINGGIDITTEATWPATLPGVLAT